uniref:Secreted protein n=1 Tax=Anopheles farauti TaxID=69004 RepID=A0A182QUT6_9DIPT
MSRLVATGAYLLLLTCYGTTGGWCYDNPYGSVHRPLDSLFRTGPSASQKHGLGSVADAGGAVVPAAHDSHASLTNDQHQQAHRQPSISGQPSQLFRGRVEPGGLTEPVTHHHHRWHADQRPANAFDGAFQRALPAIDIGNPGSANDFISHGGPPLPLNTLAEYPPSDPALDPTDNEIGDNPLLLTALNGPRESDGALVGRPTADGHAMESIDLIREQLERIKQEEDIEIKSNLLVKLLTELPEGPLPIVYIEDAAGKGTAVRDDNVDGNDGDDDVDDDADSDNGGTGDDKDDDDGIGRIRTEQLFTANGGKRSGRYYRRYPWKRQNARSRTYDAEARYLCVPSRDDVFKLLVGLHENRIGNHQKTVNFCNRKRPAKAIFTNIRFLG